jgi:hypothetical protein
MKHRFQVKHLVRRPNAVRNRVNHDAPGAPNRADERRAVPTSAFPLLKCWRRSSARSDGMDSSLDLIGIECQSRVRFH